MKAKFKKLIAKEPAESEREPIEMSESKCKQVCSLIESIEKASSMLSALNIETEDFKTQESPKISWVEDKKGKRKISDSEDSSDYSKKQPKVDHESVKQPTQGSSPKIDDKATSLPLGKRKKGSDGSSVHQISNIQGITKRQIARRKLSLAPNRRQNKQSFS